MQATTWGEAGPELSRIRYRVFVDEQRVPREIEWDGRDPQCSHVVARLADGTAIGTGRLLPDGHIGRVAVIPEWRGHGVGIAIMGSLIRLARDQGLHFVALNAQLHALGFYEALGFAAEGPEFMEAGIPHRAMRLRLARTIP